MELVKKNQLNRFKILEALYNADSGNGIIKIDTSEFLDQNNMSEREKMMQ